MKLFVESVAKYTKDSPEKALVIQRNFERVKQIVDAQRALVRVFSSAASAAQSVWLDSGFTKDQDYFVVKTDSTGNAVTIYPAAGETISGASSYSLAVQYNKVLLTFNQGVWYIIST